MEILIPGQARLMLSDGRWISVSEIESQCELITFTGSSFDPVPAVIKPADMKMPVRRIRSGAYRHLHFVEPVRLLRAGGFTNTDDLILGVRDTHRILKYNEILIPRKLSIAGSQFKDQNWVEGATSGASVDRDLVVPAYFMHLDISSLKRALGMLLRKAYPALADPYKVSSGYYTKKPNMRLAFIDKRSINLLVHLFARIGIRVHRLRTSSLLIKEDVSKSIAGTIMGLFNSKQTACDITNIDWIWKADDFPPDVVYKLQTKATNICDGSLIWAK